MADGKYTASMQACGLGGTVSFSLSTDSLQGVAKLQIPKNVYFDSLFLTEAFQPELLNFGDCFSPIYHNASPADHHNFEADKGLMSEEPTPRNYEKYSALAYSLWNLNKTANAEAMLSKIFNSSDSFFNNTAYYSSDIAGDTVKNIYGYGSYSVSLKHRAALYLSMIYIERKSYAQGLRYLDSAINKYPESYSCGTGSRWQQQEYTSLLKQCYAGLGESKKLIDLLLPAFIENSAEELVRAVRKTYTPAEIRNELAKGIRSLKCVEDPEASDTIITKVKANGHEKSETISYYIADATITLFDKEITLPNPDLKNGEHATRGKFIKMIRQSYLYKMLSRG